MFQLIVAKFNTEIHRYICVDLRRLFNFTKARATADNFQKILNPITPQIGHKFL